MAIEVFNNPEEKVVITTCYVIDLGISTNYCVSCYYNFFEGIMRMR